jgi:hypothetical protein
VCIQSCICSPMMHQSWLLRQDTLLLLMQGLVHWSGTDAVAVRKHATHMASKLQQLVQPGLLQRAPAELLQVVEEVEVLPATHTQAKMKPNPYAEWVAGAAHSPGLQSAAGRMSRACCWAGWQTWVVHLHLSFHSAHS